MPDPRETELVLDPKYDAAGLVTAVVVDRAGAPLMVAHMNADALAATQASGEATFWSRSRGRLWRKGETSGNRLKVVRLLTDCDTDTVLARVERQGDGLVCHLGTVSCFTQEIA